MTEHLMKWGICCAGRVANEFTLALRSLPLYHHKIVAVATRDKEKSKHFAAIHSIPNFYDSYEQLASSSDVEIVYVAAVQSEHYRLCKLLLEAGKHVICEKPLGVNARETKFLFELAKSRNRFLMEAIWTRCFPAYHKLSEILKFDQIGEVTHVQAQLGINFTPLTPIQTSKPLGGGATLALGIYPLQLAQFVYGEPPLEQHTFGNLHQDKGVDTDCHIFLRYSNNRTALLSSSLVLEMSNEGVVHGKKGFIKVCSPLYATTRLEVHRKNAPVEVFDFPLPKKPDYRDFKIINGIGFAYEAEEVRKCLTEGKIQSSLVTSEMSIEMAVIMERARHQLNYHMPQDKIE